MNDGILRVSDEREVGEEREPDGNASAAAAQDRAHAVAQRRRGYWAHYLSRDGGWTAAPTTSLYVMQCEGFVKVGISGNPERRLRGVAASCPFPVKLLYASDVRADVAGWAEQMAHKTLAKFHVHTEWFKCYPYLARAAIESATRRANEVPEEWILSGRDPTTWRVAGWHILDREAADRAERAAARSE